MTTLETASRNVKNAVAFMRIMVEQDAWDGATPAVITECLNDLHNAGKTAASRAVHEYFQPYLSQFPETHSRVQDILNRLPEIITQVKTLRRERNMRENEALVKAVMDKPQRFAKDDLATMENEKRLNTLHWRLSDLFIPPTPAPPQQPVRYVDTVDYAINQLFNDIDRMQDNSNNRILDLIGRLREEPFGTVIPLNEFNVEETALLSNYLLEWFNEFILPRVNDKILIVYEVAGKKPVKHPLQKDLDRVIAMFKNNQFFEVEERQTTINAYDETIYLNMFERIYFQDISGNVACPENRRSVHGDGFFPRKLNGNYKLLEPYFECCQIYANYIKDNKVKPTVNVPCFIYALEQGGIDKQKLQEILAFVGFQKRINRTQWGDIAKAFNLHIHLRIVDNRGVIDVANKNNKGWYGPADGQEVHLAEYLDHVFIDKELPITSFSLKNLDNLVTLSDDLAATPDGASARLERIIKTYKLKGSRLSVDNKRANIRTLEAIVAIDKAGGFTTINGADEDVIQANVFGYEIKEPEPIASPYNKQMHTRKMELPKHNTKELPTTATIYYADFETCKRPVTNVKGAKDAAIPFMLCVQGVIDTQEESIPVSRTYTGFDCMDQMLKDDAIVNGSIIYFHNLGFDGNFLMKYGVKKMVKKGNKIMQIPIEYNGKKITLKDSYSLFPKKLSSFPASFPKAFEGTNIQKEYFPYDYYTYERIERELNGNTKAGNFTECCKELNLSDSDKREFAHNLTSIADCIDTKTKQFNMLKYCQFYCMQDVRVLRIGFNAFAAAAREDPINLNVHNFLTLPSLADYYMKKHVFFKNGNCYELNGPVQKFIQQAVYGGRCMTAHNKRYTVKTSCEPSEEAARNAASPLYDFDARSLYPSAMNRMFVVRGVPEYYENPSPDTIFNADNLPDILKHAFGTGQISKNSSCYYSQFVVEIEITNVGIHRAFPLIVKREQNKQTNCNECVKMVVDMITLQDLITFQDISFKLGNGYVWTGSRDYTVRRVIKKLYDLRNEYKKTGNPTQEVIKLIMNSAYGKSIQKPIKSFLQFVKKDEFEFMVRDRYHQIVELTELENGVHLFELAKQKSVQFNNVLFGVTVLSMSKRIMNEVMCLAEDEGINIYYQDTDSMHIEADKLNQLAEAFKEKYDRELIGDEMGQFHDDFDELKHNPRAIVHISAGKKMYYDLLENDKGETAEHYRLKGIPQQCIKNTAKKLFQGSVQVLYEALYNGESIDFDLLDGKVCMVMDKSGHVHYKSAFNRAVKATAL